MNLNAGQILLPLRYCRSSIGIDVDYLHEHPLLQCHILAGFQFFISLVTIIPSFYDRYFQILMNVEWVTTTATQMPSVWILMVAITALAVLAMKAAAIHATVSISTVY